MKSIRQAQTWVVKRPSTKLVKPPIKNRWVFSKKFDKDGKVSRYKARLVAKGFTQRKGLDYNETWSPVVKFTSLRLLMAICARFGLESFQDDVPTAFLKGILKETIWMEQPEGYKTDDLDALCFLQKTLYGLKQSPREWNEVLQKFLVNYGFFQSIADPCIYIHSKQKEPPLLVGVYVDDIVTVGLGTPAHEFREALRSYFNITAGGVLSWYLGISFNRSDDRCYWLNQSLYLKQKMEEFDEYIGQRRSSSPLPEKYQS